MPTAPLIRPEDRPYRLRVALAEVLVVVGVLAMLPAWHAMVTELTPGNGFDDVTVRTLDLPRMLGNSGIPAVVLGLGGLFLLRAAPQLRRAGWVFSGLGVAYAASAVPQLDPGPAGIAGAVIAAAALAAAAGRWAGTGFRRIATVTVALLAAAVGTAAVYLVGVSLLQALGMALLGEFHESDMHHGATASVAYTSLKLVGWLVIAGSIVAVAARIRRRVARDGMRAVAGVMLALAAGDAAYGSVRGITFIEATPLEPWLGSVVIACGVGVLAWLSMRERTRAYLVGAGVGIAAALFGLNQALQLNGSYGLATEGAIVVTVAMALLLLGRLTPHAGGPSGTRIDGADRTLRG